MGNDNFIELAKTLIIQYYDEVRDITDSKDLNRQDIYVVWLSKVLQNNKALLSTTLSDGMYYEVTYNGDKKEMYLDAYKKWQNKAVNVFGNVNEELIGDFI